MAGADSLSPHQRHYSLIRIQEIQRQTNFRITAPDLLEKVWTARAEQDKDDRKNVSVDGVCKYSGANVTILKIFTDDI
jgi:hypothetical protein